MTKLEARFFDFVKKHIILLFLFAATALGLALRLFGMDFQSGDFRDFLNGWWSQIQLAGLGGLSQQVGNYNIPYQIITYILTLLPMTALTAYKVLSIIFDFVLACSVFLFIREVDKTESKLLPALGYAITLNLLTVVFNSAFWAQCDSIYVSFIVLAMYFTVREKTIPTFVMLGLAFAFKLQFIFILPLFLFWYVIERKASILHFLIIPAVDVILCMPAVLLGRSFSDIFTIYADQTDYGKLIQMNFPNIYAFMCSGSDVNMYYRFKTFSIVLAVLILGGVFALMLYKGTRLCDTKAFLMTGIWSVFTCLMFLSSMHERYSYLLDILLIIYAVLYRRHIAAAVAACLVSLRGYCFYLFTFEVLDLKWTAVIYTALYAYVTYVFIKETVLQPTENTDGAPAVSNYK